MPKFRTCRGQERGTRKPSLSVRLAGDRDTNPDLYLQLYSKRRQISSFDQQSKVLKTSPSLSESGFTNRCRYRDKHVSGIAMKSRLVEQ